LKENQQERQHAQGKQHMHVYPPAGNTLLPMAAGGEIDDQGNSPE
jgi:hypothetical protein